MRLHGTNFLGSDRGLRNARARERVVLLLTGTYQVECGDETFQAGAHDFVYLPVGVPHAWWVVSETPGTKLILAVPGGIESFFEGLVAGVSIDELTHRHGVDFLT